MNKRFLPALIFIGCCSLYCAIPPTLAEDNNDPGSESEIADSAAASKKLRFSNAFALAEDDVVAFVGSSAMVKQVESGALESLLTHAAGNRSVAFRDLSWQADTVYQRQRPRNFGSQVAMLDQVGATVIVSAFGQMEALDGIDRLPEFIRAYSKMLDDDVRPCTDKIVLITPFPFTRMNDKPHYPDMTRHNDAVAAYAAAIRELAKRRGWLAVDLSRFDASGLSVDGFQLNPEGHAQWATAVARQLLGERATVLPESWKTVHEQIQTKNILWRRYWRPTNWAFVYGNRQHVQSSQDHRPDKPRWFPEELNAIVPLIEEAETQIFDLQTKATQ